ncbi:hypothetical protein SAMN05216249_106105 [Acetitomaculum ruminis DSM 5522]|uniref:Tetratricopeptide repeat-containing protein n=1 Tax=Acetitomaculum ruminis DSM 5522 TaxID=1120918 RepID=A0A1I0XDA3_9FIRM|nr:hypothetical protein [Acetitomaculum ruminis]SFA99005.1 hypothetical protein SAMN05216249_106105 [Acetitomaculum ruminis DSM 5522]
MHFPLLTIFITFVIATNIAIKMSKSKNKNTVDDFWEKESKANSSRKKDINSLDYIKVPVDKLPLNMENNSEIDNIKTTIIELTDKTILNLTGISNTELKMEYGPANLQFLIEADENFTTLVRLLNALGDRFYQAGRLDECRKILEYAVFIGTDISISYETLANCYKDMDLEDKIPELIRQAKTLNSLSRAKIIRTLKSSIGEKEDFDTD